MVLTQLFEHFASARWSPQKTKNSKQPDLTILTQNSISLYLKRFQSVKTYDDFFALVFLPDPARRGSPGVFDPSSHSLVDPVLTSALLLRFFVPNFL